MQKSTRFVANANTGEEIEVIIKTEEGWEPIISYGEFIEAGSSWVYCSHNPDGGYYAMLKDGLVTVAIVRNEACIDAALSSLEAAIAGMIADGDDRPILRKWRCPQILEL